MQEFPFLDSKGHNRHPLANLIGWHYLMGSREEARKPDTKKLCLDYAFAVTKGVADETGFKHRRKATVVDAVDNYWDLYQDFLLPDGLRLREWHEDILEHVIKINDRYAKEFADDEPLPTVFQHTELLNILARNCVAAGDDRAISKNHEILKAAYKKPKDDDASLKHMVNEWLAKYGNLPAGDAPYDELWTKRMLGPNGVLEFCVRAITQFANTWVKKHALRTRKEQVGQAYERSGTTSRRFKHFPYWGLVGLAPPRISKLQGEVTLTKSFFSEPGCAKIWQNLGTFKKEQFDLTRLFIYSGVDETRGIRKLQEWCIRRCQQVGKTFRAAFNMAMKHETGFNQTTAIPWRLVEGVSRVGVWPLDSCRMEVTNHRHVNDVLESMKIVEVLPKRVKRKRGRSTDIVVAKPPPKLKEPYDPRWPAIEELEMDYLYDPRWPAIEEHLRLRPIETLAREKKRMRQDDAREKQADDDLRERLAYTGEYTEEAYDMYTTAPPNYMLWGGAILVGVAGFALSR